MTDRTIRGTYGAEVWDPKFEDTWVEHEWALFEAGGRMAGLEGLLEDSETHFEWRVSAEDGYGTTHAKTVVFGRAEFGALCGAVDEWRKQEKQKQAEGLRERTRMTEEFGGHDADFEEKK